MIRVSMLLLKPEVICAAEEMTQKPACDLAGPPSSLNSTVSMVSWS